MAWLDWSTRVTRYIGPKLRPRHSPPEFPGSLGEALDECSTPYLTQSSRCQDSHVRDALEYLTALEKDADADDVAIAWARHELLRCVRAAKENVLRDG
jgi:hypothetical protein